MYFGYIIMTLAFLNSLMLIADFYNIISFKHMEPKSIKDP